jgi:hypothetical protein
MYLTDPILGPLFSTIVATRYMIRQTIMSMIHWNDREIIRFAYAAFIDWDSRVAMFILYKLIHMPPYQL